MDEIDTSRKLHILQENEFVGSIKKVQRAREGKSNKTPKPDEIFDMKHKEGQEVKFSKKKKTEVVMPYQKKNFNTGEMEKPKNRATYNGKKK